MITHVSPRGVGKVLQVRAPGEERTYVPPIPDHVPRSHRPASKANHRAALAPCCAFIALVGSREEAMLKGGA
jgi:hypothetical protein